jgi:hypothetical protein
MKKNTGRVEGEDFSFEQFEEDLKHPPTDLWLRHLATSEQMVNDFQRYLGLQIARAQAHAVNLKGPELKDDLLRLQGGIRAIATIRYFVSSFLKQTIDSGRVVAGLGGVDAGRPERINSNSRSSSG